MPVFVGGQSGRWLGFYLDSDGGVDMKYNNSNMEECTVNYQVNVWHEALITYDGNEGRLYLDGELGCRVIFDIDHYDDKRITLADYSNALTYKGMFRDLRVYDMVIVP
jgi:hypothetical protein